MAKRFSLLTEYSESELQDIIASAIKQALETFESKSSPPSAAPPWNEPLLSRTDVCKKLKLSNPTVSKLHKQGKLKAIVVGGSYRYSKKSIADFMSGN